MTLLLTTDTVDPGQRLARWRTVLRRVCGNFEADFDAGPTFRGEVGLSNVAGLNFATIVCPQGRVIRASRSAQSEGHDLFFFIVQRDGSSTLSQGGAEAVLQPGEAALIDASRASEFYFPAHSRQISLHIPAVLLRERSRTAPVRPAVRFKAEGYCKALLAFIASLTEDVSQLPPQTSQLARTQLLDGIAQIVGGEASEYTDSTRVRIRLPHVQEVIRRHLGDADLSIERIASRAGVSVRQLQRMFRAEGTTFGDWVRKERLERCYFDLIDARPGSDSITSIGFRWGFSDASHFSRAFRAHFGFCARDAKSHHLLRAEDTGCFTFDSLSTAGNCSST